MAANSPYVVSYAAPTTIGELSYWCENEYERISVVFSSFAETISGDLDARYFRKAGDTWDLGALQVFPKDPAAVDSSDAEMGFINFFGINALLIQAKTPNTELGIGCLLLTDRINEAFPFVVGSKYDGFRVRNQIYRDDPTITDPEDPDVYEPDSIVTVDYALNKYVTSDTPTFTGIATFNNDGSPAGGIVVNGSVLGVGINCSSLILGNGFNANGQRGVNFADPINDQDVTTKKWVTDNAAVGNFVTIDTTQTVTGAKTFTASTVINNQLTLNGGTSGGLIITGSGAGFSVDATGVILGRAGFNSNNQRITNVLDPVNDQDAATKKWVSDNAAVGNFVTVDTTQTVTGAKTFTASTVINNQLTLNGGTSGGLIITGSGAGFSIDATGVVLGRAGFNAFNQKMTSLAPGTSGTDAVNVNQLNGKANATHFHDASQVTSGVFAIARIPTGTSGSTVALGNHGHAGVYAPVSTTVTTNTVQTITQPKTFSAGFTSSVGVALNGGSLNGGSRVQGVGNPIVGGDAANRTYVDGAVSDARLKESVSDDVDSSVLHQLRIVSFKYNLDSVDAFEKPSWRDGKHYGVLAQEAEKVLPEAVYDSVFEGYKAFDYEMLVPLLVKELQEQRKEISQLKQQITGGQ